MEKVVYFTGAGFSAPLGIPVMNNFLLKSKDMYFSNTEKYKHFSKVFETINALAVSKNYYTADLFNIEEILSILEMQEYLGDRRNIETFCKYISDVIDYYTPQIEPSHEENIKKLPGNFYDFILGKDDLIRSYIFFVGNLINLKITKKNNIEEKLYYSITNNPDFSYSIVTLNYDMVIENALDYIDKHYTSEKQINSVALNKEPISLMKILNLSKLHGTIKPLKLILPTWNKGSNEKVLPAWKSAHKSLEEANYIRIIGYSLPITDSYIRYLLKSSVLKSKHLKAIDVICLDPDGEVKKRYDNFINFKYYQFRNMDLKDYLKVLHNQQKQEFYDSWSRGQRLTTKETTLEFTSLEYVHRLFM